MIDTSFNYSLQEFSDNQQGLVGQYSYNNHSYHLKIQLIIKTNGLFYIEQGISPDIEPNQNFERKCSNLGNNGHTNMNNGADNNISMLNSSPDPHYNDWILQKPAERFHRFGGYAFYVRE